MQHQFLNHATLPPLPMSCVPVQQEQFTGYLVHHEFGISSAYLIYQDLSIENVTIHNLALHDGISQLSYQSVPILVPTSFGYITTTSIFTLNFDLCPFPISTAITFDIAQILDKFNIAIETMQVSDIRQTGHQLTWLFVIRNQTTQTQQLHVIYGNIPFQFLDQDESDNHQESVEYPTLETRRLLMAETPLQIRRREATPANARPPRRLPPKSTPKRPKTPRIDGNPATPRAYTPKLCGAKPIPAIPKIHNTPNIMRLPKTKNYANAAAVVRTRPRRTPTTTRIVACDTIELKVGLTCMINDIRYEIIRRLGNGAHGTVYKALRYSDTPTKMSTVAVKQFDDESLFINENTLYAGLKGIHGVVHQIDASKPTEESQTFLLVLDYIESGDLMSFIERPPIKYTNEKAIDIVKKFLLDVSYALEYFNEFLQWLHADVKPDNILLSFIDGIPSFYLSDLSCSMPVGNYSSGSLVGGTPVWMSPEMLSASYLGTVTFPSQMCIDAYGLELVAMHLYGAICQSRPSNVDLLCEEARSFEKICDRMEYKYTTDGNTAFDKGIRERSEAVRKVIVSLGYAIDKQSLDRLLNRQVSLINILSSHLIRVPLNSADKDITWLRSAPSQCITWNEWRSAVESI